MSTFRNFGHLIRIDGSINSKWSAYATAKTSGNIVFADLTSTTTTGMPSEGYAPGYYIYANGVEYKVADLIKFNALKASYDAYVISNDASVARLDASVNAADASIDALQAWQKALTFDLTNNIISIKDGDKLGVNSSVTVTDGNYVTVTSAANNVLNVKLVDDLVKKGTGTYANSSLLATEGYVNQTVDTLETRLDTSIKNINSSIADISTRLNDASTRMSTMVDTVVMASSTTGNVTTVTLTKTTEAGTTTTDSYTIKGDKYIEVTSDANASTNLKLHVEDTSAAFATPGNSSLVTAGGIKEYVDAQIQSLESALEFKGNISTAADLDAKLAVGSKGDVYVATAKFTTSTKAGSKVLEIGDMVILTSDATETVPSTYIVVERNLTGAVTTGGSLTANHVVLGGGEQVVKDSSYVLSGENTSTNFGGTDWMLPTEKGVKSYVDGKVAGQSMTAVEVNPTDDYFAINASMYEAGKFRVTSGINVTTFSATDASTVAGATLADAATFKQAINDVHGTLVVTANGKDSSALLALQMTGGNSSLLINGGNYAEVSVDNGKLKVNVKSSSLVDASKADMGLAVAHDVFTTIDTYEKANALAHDTIRKSVGLDESLAVTWDASRAAAYGTNSSVIDVIEKLDDAWRAETTRLDSSVKAMDLTNTDANNKVIVGVAQKNGIVTTTSAGIRINGVDFKRTVGTDASLTATISGDHIKVAGTSVHKDSSISKAILDLSTAIDETKTGYISKINGDEDIVKTSTTYVEGAYVAVKATRRTDAGHENDVDLDTSVLMSNPVDVSNVSGYTKATATGIASDAYVKDYVASILEWEEI